MASPAHAHCSHGRTASEAQLLNLHLNFSPAGHFTPIDSFAVQTSCSSRINDDDFDTLFTPLQPSEFESEEDAFARKAELALQRLSATLPDFVAGPTQNQTSSSRAETEDRFSPFSVSPLPAYEYGENPYFRLGGDSKTLYNDGQGDVMRWSPTTAKIYSSKATSPQSSDGSISSGGDPFSSYYTNSSSSSSCLDQLPLPQSSPKSGLAARRGKSSESLRLRLPPRESGKASSAPSTTEETLSPETITRTLSMRKSDGVLRNNFEGVALPKNLGLREAEFEADLDSPLFRRPRKDNGFAF